MRGLPLSLYREGTRCGATSGCRELRRRLVEPSVVENRMGIHTQAAASEPGSGTPGDATFMIQHLMGYVVCP